MTECDDLAHILNRVKEHIVFFDNAGNVIYVNKEFTELLELEMNISSSVNIVGKNLWKLLPQLVGTSLFKNISEAINKKEIRVVEWGSLSSGRFWETTIFPSDKDVIAIGRDVTERKKAEGEIKKSRQRLSDILSSIDEYIFSLDKDWNIIYISNRAATAAGFEPKEVIGKSFWMIGSVFIGTEVERNFREVMSKREVIRFERKSVFREGFTEFTVFPSVEGITVYGKDITKRKNLEHQLEEYTKNLERLVEERTRKVIESEQSYRELYESFDEAFIAVDWELTVIHWNKAAERVTTVPAKDALGKKVYEVLPEMMSVNVESYYEALASKKPARFIMNVVSRQTGKLSIFEISTYPSTRGIIIIVEDITEEEQTRRLSIIGQTAGMVGHDIRNPLQAIMGDLYLLKTDAQMPNQESRQSAIETIDIINENISYINKIVSDLQDYASKAEPTLEEVDLESIIDKAFSTINIPKNIKAQCTIEPNLKLKTDVSYIRRVITNLVTNAIQAMPNEGKLTIEATGKDGAVQIIVADTGQGIPKEVQDKLFTPLFTTKSKGQGLGLAVVKKFVEELGGTISFESQEGKGTKFFIELPTK